MQLTHLLRIIQIQQSVVVAESQIVVMPRHTRSHGSTARGDRSPTTTLMSSRCYNRDQLLFLLTLDLTTGMQGTHARSYFRKVAQNIYASAVHKSDAHDVASRRYHGGILNCSAEGIHHVDHANALVGYGIQSPPKKCATQPRNSSFVTYCDTAFLLGSGGREW